MGNSPLRIALQTPQTCNIRLSESAQFALGVGQSIPYGMAKLTIDTSANWANKSSYIPKRGEIVVYSDRRVIDDVLYPGIKIGDGKAYVADLPFAGDDSASMITDALNAHIENHDIHITPDEREYWNNKLDCEIEGENLTLSPKERWF